MLGHEEIAANVRAVNERIAAACARAGRDRGEVTLIAVTKTFPAAAVDAAVAAGVTDIGENRVQEVRDKKADVRARAHWHLIGHLQSNKAKEAIRYFDIIQTIDSLALAEKVARAAEGAGKRQEVLLQVNVGREEQKSGAAVEETESIAGAIAAMPSLHLRGLMTIPPIAPEADTRRRFAELRALRDGLKLEHLSMGMSDDYEIAIEEGATLVRVGRAIFGSRG